MSYWSQLESARRCLTAGDFLEAERLYFEAREGHQSSRLRAPLMEKGVEPLLRWGRRLAGRPDEGPVVPAFAAKASEIFSDLEDVAQLHLQDARRRVSAGEEELDAESVTRLATTLRMHRESRLFDLGEEYFWPVLKFYLSGCSHHHLEINPALLSEQPALPREAMDWLCGWISQRLSRRATDLTASAPWFIARLRPLSEDEEDPLQGEAGSLLTVMLLLDPHGAPAALVAGRAALAAAHPPQDPRWLLRLVAGLACNEKRLACAHTSSAMMSELHGWARQLGVAWPPEELGSLMRGRHPSASAPVLASLAFEGGPGQRVVLVKHVGAAPLDVLILKPGEESGDEDDPFACTMTEAVAHVGEWLDEGIPVLCEEEIPGWLESLLGERSIIPLAALETVLPTSVSRARAAAPSCPHPLLDGEEDAVSSPWMELVTKARALPPRLLDLAESPALGSAWGLRNLEVLGRAGLGLARRLAAALRILLGPPTIGDPDLMQVEGTVRLEWPRLADRPWPGERLPLIPAEYGGGDLLLHGRPSPGELAGWALAAAPSLLICRNAEEGQHAAACLAGHLDARAVTLAPRRAICPEPAYALLDSWIEESLVEESRILDVLWLYKALATCPDGDLARWIEQGGHPEARKALAERLAGESTRCSERCRLARGDSCFEEQLAHRRRHGEIWIEWAEHLEREDPEFGDHLHLVSDDIVRLLSDVDDVTVLRRLDGMLRRAGEASGSALWSRTAVVAERAASELSQRLPAGRSFRSLVPDGERPLSIHMSPRGYAPGDSLFAEESQALIRARVSAWQHRQRPARAWMPPAVAEPWRQLGGAHALSGSVETPSHDAVVVALLGEPGALDPCLALFRLAAAASHSRLDLACVDPRLSELFDNAWSLAPAAEILTDPAPATSGAAVLNKLSARQLAHWKHPLQASRLHKASASLPAATAPPGDRIAELARVISPLGRSTRLALGSCLVEDRVLVATTLSLMAAQSRDGGPLGASQVVWIGDALPEELRFSDLEARLSQVDEQNLADVLARADASELELLSLPPRLLGDARVQDWLPRSPRAWLFPEADLAWKGHPAHDPRLLGFMDQLSTDAAADSFILAFLDEGDLSADGPVVAVAESCRAEVARVGDEDGLSGWRCQRVRLEDPSWNCGACGSKSELGHAHAICLGCGAALLEGEGAAAAVDESLHRARMRWLSRQGLDSRWLVVASDARERDTLRRGLGIESMQETTPLLDGRDEYYSLRIVELTELWDQTPPEGELLFTRIPADSRLLRSALSRLRARGRGHGVVHLMDHPLCWERPRLWQKTQHHEETVVLSGALLRWGASRAEVEFRAESALSQLERALRARSGHVPSTRRGLGPEAAPQEIPRLAPLARAVESWWGGDQLTETSSTEAMEWVRQCLDHLDTLGLGFEGAGTFHLPLERLAEDPAGRLAAESLLQWCVLEKLLLMEGQARRRVDSGEAALLIEGPEVRRWRQSARTLPTGIASALPSWPVAKAKPVQDAEGSLDSAPEWLLGVPGSGRSRRLLHKLEAILAEGGSTPLLLVPAACTLLRWEGLLREADIDAHRVQCGTVEELILAFLRAHHGLGGFAQPPRLLEAAATPEGEELRHRLLRETSRRYAVAAGGSPPVDLVQMRRILEAGAGDELPLAASAAAGSTSQLDLPLLHKCAAEVRREAGWILPQEVGPMSRRWLVEHPYVGEAWRDRYPRVLVDDADAFSADEMAFLERLFPESYRCTVADPALIHEGRPFEGDAGDRKSGRLPRELARAAETLIRDELVGRGSLKARGRDKGRLDRRQVLNLEACVLTIESALSGRDWQRLRVGVVLAYGGDLPRLASRLREVEIPVWPAAQVLPACLPGPREFLMALVLAGQGPEMEPLMAASLAVELLRSAGVDLPDCTRDEFGARLMEFFRRGEARPLNPAESFVLPLVALGRRLESVESLGEAAEMLARSHLLLRLRRDEAAAARLDSYLEERSDMPWRGAVRGMDPAGLVEPLAPGPRVWLLEVDDLAGLELDRAFYLCTGHEPPDIHYRVLGRVRESLTVLYSEADPFAPHR